MGAAVGKAPGWPQGNQIPELAPVCRALATQNRARCPNSQAAVHAKPPTQTSAEASPNIRTGPHVAAGQPQAL